MAGMDKQVAREGEGSKKIVPPTKARSGEISGRTPLVLTVSLLLAVLAMVALLGYFYSTHSTSLYMGG